MKFSGKMKHVGGSPKKGSVKPLHKRHIIEFTQREVEYLSLEEEETPTWEFIPCWKFVRYLRYSNKVESFVGYKEYRTKVLKDDISY